jgi:hypothetical protein
MFYQDPMLCLSFEVLLALYGNGLMQSGLPTELKKGHYFDDTTSIWIFFLNGWIVNNF